MKIFAALVGSQKNPAVGQNVGSVPQLDFLSPDRKTQADGL